MLPEKMDCTPFDVCCYMLRCSFGTYVWIADATGACPKFDASFVLSLVFYIQTTYTTCAVYAKEKAATFNYIWNMLESFYALSAWSELLCLRNGLTLLYAKELADFLLWA